METVRLLAAYVAVARGQPLSVELRAAASRGVLDLVAAAAAGIAAPGPRHPGGLRRRSGGGRDD